MPVQMEPSGQPPSDQFVASHPDDLKKEIPCNNRQFFSSFSVMIRSTAWRAF